MDTINCGPGPRCLAVLVVFALCAPALASDTGLAGGEGHPRARFPLTVHAQPLGEPRLDAAVKRAVDDWNAVAEETLGLRAFAWVERREAAQVTLATAPAPSPKMMGVTHVRADDAGVIALPVRIVLYEATARGQTSRETVLYQIVAHELGHALGLPHTRDLRSLMCCVAASVDFNDPVAREAYIQMRRHPDVRTVRGELAEHYGRVWRRSRP